MALSPQFCQFTVTSSLRFDGLEEGYSGWGPKDGAAEGLHRGSGPLAFGTANLSPRKSGLTLSSFSFFPFKPEMGQLRKEGHQPWGTVWCRERAA